MVIDFNKATASYRKKKEEERKKSNSKIAQFELRVKEKEKEVAPVVPFFKKADLQQLLDLAKQRDDRLAIPGIISWTSSSSRDNNTTTGSVSAVIYSEEFEDDVK